MEKMNDKLSGQMSKLAALPIAARVVIALFFFVVLMAFPAAMIVIGAKYLDSCPAKKSIPLWLIVSGSTSIFIVLLIVFILCLLAIFRVIAKRKGESPPIWAVFCFMVLLMLVSMFGFGWFIAGNVWVFSLKSTVDFINDLSPSFCNGTVYQFAFWSIIATYLIIVFNILRSCFSRLCCCCCKESSHEIKPSYELKPLNEI